MSHSRNKFPAYLRSKTEFRLSPPNHLLRWEHSLKGIEIR